MVSTGQEPEVPRRIQIGLYGREGGPEPDERIHAIDLAGAAKDYTHRKLIREIAVNAPEPNRVRIAAIRALGKFNEPADVKALAAITREPRRQEGVIELFYHKLAIQVLGAMPGKEALAALQSLLLDGKTYAELKSEIVAALAGTRPGTIWLLDTHQKGELPKELRRAGRPLAPQLPLPGRAEPALCCSSPRRVSSTPRTCPPSPNSPSALAMRPAARRSGTPAPLARRSVPSATWFAASAGRSGPTSP